MKVFKDIGSKERLFEIFQNVNRVKLNEDFGNQLDSKQTLELSFNDLLNNRLKINEVNTQADDNEVSVELVCFDNTRNNIIFRFTGIANESATDGIFTFNDAKIIGFSFDAANDSGSVELDESGLQEFNAQHQKEILDVVTNHADVESGVETPAFGIEEAIKIIDAIKMDSMPFGGEFEKMQTPKNYVDKKPVNDKIRVDSPELDKFVQETEDYLRYIRGTEGLPWQEKERGMRQFIGDNETYFNSLHPMQQMKIQAFSQMKAGKELGIQSPEQLLRYLQGSDIIKIEKFQDLVMKYLDSIVEELRVQSLNENTGANVDDLIARKAAEMQIDLQPWIDAAPKIEVVLQGQPMQEGEYPEKMGKEFSPQTSYPKKRKKHPHKVKIKTGAAKPTTISEYYEEDDEIEIAGLPEIPSGRGAKMQAVKDIKQDVGNELAPEIGSDAGNNDMPIGTKINEPHDWRPEIGRHMDIKEPYPYTSPLREEDTETAYGGKLNQIQQELSQIKSRLDTGRTPKMWVGDDDLLHVSAEDGEYFADYSNEFGDGYPTIDGRLEAIAEKYGLYWDWDDPGSIVLVDDSMAEGKESVDVEEPEEKEIGGEIKMSPEDNERMLQIAGIKKAKTEPENDGMSLEPETDQIAQLADKREEMGDQIEGGKGDDVSPLEFTPEQILKGMKVEMEHTDDPMLALEITLDHLVEDEFYYGTEDEDPDKVAQKAAATDAEKFGDDDKETEDELLGFKPKNVGDYVGDEEEEDDLDETGSSWKRI